jgi:uncharacterized Zn finger protein
MRSREYYGFRPYVPVAERQRRAALKLSQLEKKGVKVEGVRIHGTKIARTFWGQAWCDNLEAYSDYANRLPRGRTYVRTGSVVDLQVERGRVTAMVSGSELYKVEVSIQPLASTRWKPLVEASSGEMLSMVDLLGGTFSEQVMKRFCDRAGGLFPAPKEIRLKCSCPDWAEMCKHVAAALYGVGARLDARPELLFSLRGVDPLDLVTAVAAAPARVRAPRAGKVLDSGGLGSIFGIELGQIPTVAVASAASASRARATRQRVKAKATVVSAAPSKKARTPKGQAHDRLSQVASELDQVVALLKASEGGLRAAEIRAALNLEAKALVRVLKEGLTKGMLETRGRTRSTTYSVVRPGPSRRGPRR